MQPYRVAVAGLLYAISWCSAATAPNQGPPSVCRIDFSADSGGAHAVIVRDHAGVRIDIVQTEPGTRVTGPLLRVELERALLAPRGSTAEYFDRGSPSVIQSARCQLADVYPGVDLDVYPVAAGIEYDLILRPGAKANDIALRIEGSGGIRFEPSGELSVEQLADTSISQTRPFAYQLSEFGLDEVEVRTAFRDGALTFDLGPYDPYRPLVIDPVITVSRMYGGSSSTRFHDLRLGADGFVYAYGETAAANATALSSSIYTNAGARNHVVYKLDPRSLETIYAVAIGRRTANPTPSLVDDQVESDRVEGFAVGEGGRVYAVAYQTGTSFPSTGGVYFGGAGSKYIFRVSADGQVDRAYGPLDPAITTVRALAVDGATRVAITGRAASGLVTTPTAAITSSQTGGLEAPFVQIIDIAEQRVLASTYLTVPNSRTGTIPSESYRTPVIDGKSTGYAIAFSDGGAVVVAGQATSRDFPTSSGALDTTDTVFRDAFVASVAGNGTSIQFVARLGGGDHDRATGIAVAPDGKIVVTGKSLWSGNRMTTTADAFQTSVSHTWQYSVGFRDVPWEEGFLVVLSADGRTRNASARIGAHGGNLDRHARWGPLATPTRVALDSLGNVYLTGTTEEGSSLPDHQPILPAGLMGDGYTPFLLAAPSHLRSTLFASGFGGTWGDGIATGVASPRPGLVYVGGYTISPYFPVLGPLQAVRSGRSGVDTAFVAKIAETPTVLTVSAFPTPSLVGQVVTLNASFPDYTPGMSVEFRANDSPLAVTPLTDGVATLSTVLGAGVHRLTATLVSSDGWNGFKSVTVVHRVEQTSATQ